MQTICNESLSSLRWGECWSAVIYHNSVKDLLQPISVSWSEERKGEMNEWGNEIDWTHHQSGCISHVNFTIKIIGQWTGHPISAVFPIESFILFFYHLDQVRPVAAWSYLLLSTNNWLPTIIDHWSVLVLLSSLQLCPAGHSCPSFVINSAQVVQWRGRGRLRKEMAHHYHYHLLCRSHFTPVTLSYLCKRQNVHFLEVLVII